MTRRKKRYPLAYKKKPKFAIARIVKKIAMLSIIFIGVWLLVVGVYAVKKNDFFPIQAIRLFVDEQFVDVSALKHLIREQLQGNFFTASLNSVSHALEAVDQINTVSVRRVWPYALWIYIDGYQPAAYWNQHQVITAAGYIFNTPRHMQKKLSVSLKGSPQFAADMSEWLMVFNEKLKPLELTITTLTFKENVYSLVLSNDLHVILGHHDLIARLDRFVGLYFNVIGACADKISLVDLRYGSGAAVKWKSSDHRCAALT
jgi:cell division protein FtsQ